MNYPEDMPLAQRHEVDEAEIARLEAVQLRIKQQFLTGRFVQDRGLDRPKYVPLSPLEIRLNINAMKKCMGESK